MRNYQIATGAVVAKHALRFPLKTAAVLLHIKNALLEIFTARKNRYMPNIGFTYRDLVACFATGAARFVSAPRNQRDRRQA